MEFLLYIVVLLKYINIFLTSYVVKQDMEFRFVNNVYREEFAKLRVFDIILDVREFISSPNVPNTIIFDVDENQSLTWNDVMKETLFNFHFKLMKSPESPIIYGEYKWENVYPPNQRLEVNLTSASVTFRFRYANN